MRDGIGNDKDRGGACVGPPGIEDLELRGRSAQLIGGTDSDFGERPNDWRAELRMRYFF